VTLPAGRGDGFGPISSAAGDGLAPSSIPVGGFFRTPRVLPAAVYLRIRLSAALSVGTTLLVDHLAMAEPTRLYQQGPYIAPFSASANVIKGDSFSIAVTNDRGGYSRPDSVPFSPCRRSSSYSRRVARRRWTRGR
jgi:hypothetical protein